MVDLGNIDAHKTASDPELPEPREKPEHAHKPYLVSVADVGGVFREEQFESFDEALLAYKTWQDDMDPHNYATGRRIYRHVFSVSNLDLCEHDGEKWHSGLTDEEKEEL